MKSLEKITAEKLLKIKAVKLQPSLLLHGLQVGNRQFIATTES